MKDTYLYFTSSLLKWYPSHARQLPWRETKDAYSIWLSEVILQQTQVKQGLPYYLKFKAAFPTVADLANAEWETVSALWQGLGYYSRARNLHKTAKEIHKNQQGKFPKETKNLQKLPGVGEYTAAAISSFAFGTNAAVRDTNVDRVVARWMATITTVGTSAFANEIKAHLAELHSKTNDNPSLNQALMEFGALVCTAKNPLCISCPVQGNCLAFAQQKVDMLPVKKLKKPREVLQINWVVLYNQKGFYATKRPEKGIWASLWSFPEKPEVSELLPEQPITRFSKVQKHILTHRLLEISWYECSIPPGKQLKQWTFVPWENWTSFGYPQPIFTFLQKLHVSTAN